MHNAARLTILAATVVVALAPALQAPSANAVDTLTCFDRPASIAGTPGDDILDGTPGDDVIVGLGGGDFIQGEGGNDMICAGPNPTRFIPKYGVDGDTVHGGAGSDLIAGGAGLGELFGEAGDDTIYLDDVAGPTEPPVSAPPSKTRPVCLEPGNGIDGPVNDGLQRV